MELVTDTLTQTTYQEELGKMSTCLTNEKEQIGRSTHWNWIIHKLQYANVGLIEGCPKS